jgi:hypothetical protein
MRAAFSGDIELVKLPPAHGADTKIYLEGQRDGVDGRVRNRFHPGL